MKSMCDLEIMKVQSCYPFESAYSFLITRMADQYISKSDGIERIMDELAEWDIPSQKCILHSVITEVYKNSF